jgi:hypothetical protein
VMSGACTHATGLVLRPPSCLKAAGRARGYPGRCPGLGPPAPGWALLATPCRQADCAYPCTGFPGAVARWRRRVRVRCRRAAEGRTPRSWAERAYHKLIYFNEVDKGGHFAAWEQPDARLRRLTGLVARGAIAIFVGERYPLAQAAEALEQARRGTHGAATVLRPADPG